MNYKHLLFSILACVTIIQVQAQVTFKPGLRAGLNFSTFTETHSSYKTGFYVGGFGEIKLAKRYTLQPEITYTEQGSNNVTETYYDYFTNTEKTERKDLKLNYLSTAVMNKFTFGNGFQLQVGPTLDFVLNDNLKRRFSDVDLAIVAGIGYKLPSGLTLEARVKKGIIDVLDDNYSVNNNDYLFGDYNTNFLFQLGASYSFGK